MQDQVDEIKRDNPGESLGKIPKQVVQIPVYGDRFSDFKKRAGLISEGINGRHKSNIRHDQSVTILTGHAFLLNMAPAEGLDRRCGRVLRTDYRHQMSPYE